MPTFAEHAARRRKIADEMESSPVDQRRGEIDGLAHKYNVCRATVFVACREHQVKMPQAR